MQKLSIFTDMNFRTFNSVLHFTSNVSLSCQMFYQFISFEVKLEIDFSNNEIQIINVF